MILAMDLLSKPVAYIVVIAMFILIVGSFIFGYQYRKNHFVCDDNIQYDTTYVYDTVIHEITQYYPYYVEKIDTILYPDSIFINVDTAEILKDYFAIKVHNRIWVDSLLNVWIKDSISQNKIIGHKFEYKILRPQEIVTVIEDNSVHYDKYLNVSLTAPIKYPEYTGINLSYIYNKASFGVGYIPKHNSFSLSAGMNIYKFRK
jgi:hypothetical protein